MAHFDLSAVSEFHDYVTNGVVADTIHVQHANYRNTVFTTLKYKKDCLTRDNVKTLGLLRSVILDSANNVVCFAPPKSVSYEDFCQKQNDDDDDETTNNIIDTNVIHGESFIDGVMVNAFFVPSLNSWEIATRTVVGAHTNFYFYKNYGKGNDKGNDNKSNNGNKGNNNKAKENNMNCDCTSTNGVDGVDDVDGENKSMTFREMFFEAAELAGLDLNEHLDKSNCYSFVLQHPKNRIVSPVEYPRLVLTRCYRIDTQSDDDDGNKTRTMVVPVDLKDQDRENCDLPIYRTNVQHVCRYNFDPNRKTTFAEFRENLFSFNTPYTVMGMVLQNKTTLERTKLRNLRYEYVRRLRGNQANMHYQYFYLFRHSLVTQYLEYYPEDRNTFREWGQQVKTLQHDAYHHYRDVYVCKTRNLKTNPLPKPLYSLICSLHTMYTTTLREQGFRITLPYVKHYINNILSIEQLLHCLQHC